MTTPQFRGYRDVEAAGRAAPVDSVWNAPPTAGADPSVGEFLLLAEERLSRVFDAVAGSAAWRWEERRAVIAGLTLFTRSLARFESRLGWFPGIRGEQLPVLPVQGAVRAHLAQAVQAFARAGDAEPGTSESARYGLEMRDAAQLLGVALDVFEAHREKAHTLGGPSGPGQVDGMEARRWAMGRLGVLAAAAGAIASELPQGARREFNPALLQAGRALSAVESSIAEHLPSPSQLHHAAARVTSLILAAGEPVRPGESRGAACAALQRGLDRLTSHAFGVVRGDSAEDPTASALRQVAFGLAVAGHQASGMLARGRAAFAEALGGDAPAAELIDAAAAELGELSRRWHEVARAWRGVVSVPDSGPTHALAADGAALAVRWGRLGHEPGWTPQHRTEPLPDAELVPHAAAAERLLGQALALARAAGPVASAHLTWTQREAARGLLFANDPKHTPKGYLRLQPYPINGEQTDRLRRAYVAAWTTALGEDGPPALAELARRVPEPRPLPGRAQGRDAVPLPVGEVDHRGAEAVRAMMLLRNERNARSLRMRREAWTERVRRGNREL